jgi:hypothetical protein
MANTHEHLEHAEHAQHAAHDPFQARVAITMAVIAALLAAVTLLGHRAHNETLQAEIEANILQTQASDQWNFFQAKNIRDHEYEAYLPILDSAAKEPGKEEVARKARDYWAGQRAKYKTELPELNEKAKSLEKASEGKRNESHLSHERGTRFDLGEICIDVGLVVCSIALLTKRRAFWFGGTAAAALGGVLAATAFFLTPPAEGHEQGHDTAAEHQSTDKAPGH